MTDMERRLALVDIVRMATYYRDVNRFPLSAVVDINPSRDLIDRCSPSDREWLTEGAASAAVRVLWP